MSASVWYQRRGVVIQQSLDNQVWLSATQAVGEARRLRAAGQVELSGQIADALRRGWGTAATSRGWSR